MARESIGPVTPTDVEFALKRLESVADSLRSLDESFKANPSETEMWIWRGFSLNDGLRRLEAIVPEVNRAIYAHAASPPQNENNSKSRTTKKAAADKLSQAEEAIAKSKKKAKPKE